METALTLAFIVLFYLIALALFLRFFAFLRNCDSEMRLMIENGKNGDRFPVISQKKKRMRRARAPRLAAA